MNVKNINLLLANPVFVYLFFTKLFVFRNQQNVTSESSTASRLVLLSLLRTNIFIFVVCSHNSRHHLNSLEGPMIAIKNLLIFILSDKSSAVQHSAAPSSSCNCDEKDKIVIITAEIVIVWPADFCKQR